MSGPAIIQRLTRATRTPVQYSRSYSSTSSLRNAPPFRPAPAPPRLSKEEQEIYEQLQRASTGAFSTPNDTVVVKQSAQTSASEGENRAQSDLPSDAAGILSPEQKLENIIAKVTATGEGEELHPDVRRGAKPEFEGDRNPKTGEVGGPKNEPLRWGGKVDWSYNGRVTDF